MRRWRRCVSKHHFDWPSAGRDVYTYTGNPYAFFIDTDPPKGEFTTAMKVTGSFTLSAPLGAGLEHTDVTANVLSFSFSNGRDTISDSNADFKLFQFTTDVFGDFSGWHIQLQTAAFTAAGQQRAIIDISWNEGGTIADRGILMECLIFPGCTIRGGAPAPTCYLCSRATPRRCAPSASGCPLP
jgi:hypothetical protein